MRDTHFPSFAHLILSNNPSAYAKQVLIREGSLYYQDFYSSCYVLTLDEKDFAINRAVERFSEYVNLSTSTLDSLDTIRTTLAKILQDSYTESLERSFRARGLSMA
jgi:hypothetical protein